LTTIYDPTTAFAITGLTGVILTTAVSFMIEEPNLTQQKLVVK